MDYKLNKQIKSLLKENHISEARLGYQLGKHRTTINSHLALPLAKSTYEDYKNAISEIIKGDNKHDK